MAGGRTAYLTLQEAAELLKVSKKTAYRMVQAGRLPGFKVGSAWRFRESDIDKWVDQLLSANPVKERHGQA